VGDTKVGQKGKEKVLEGLPYSGSNIKGRQSCYEYLFHYGLKMVVAI
jgi:hypothetical protein